MKLNKLFIVLFALTFLFFVGCDEDDDINEFEVLVEYLEGDDGGYVNNLGTWIFTEASVNLDDYLVLDLRSATDFDATPNPIADAVNTTLSGMWALAEAATEPILVTCYSGQTASFAHTLLRLKGYEAYTMKFGMSWHDVTLDKWTVKCVDTYAGDLVTTASPTLPSFDYPELNTGEEDGAAILDARIDAAIAAWGAGLLVSAETVMNEPASYNIINYWVEADYLDHGHIDGSYQVTPSTLTMDENLSVFDPIGGNIFYCYTGQTAAASIAYLTVLGYDVKSIAYGFNNMNWSELPGHKWSKPYSG
ncbi:MAG: rhodanese-like domain-containing protein [Candidatus Marinimicrobia bacterium]|nr:rhodanese-like domain-containing protein [Candidatus Neomarinimicrobiota bacterium]